MCAGGRKEVGCLCIAGRAQNPTGSSSTERRQQLFAGELKALTPNSICTPQQLEREIINTIKQGYALSKDDVALGLSALGMPLYNEQESFWSLFIAGLSPYFEGERKTELPGLAPFP